MNKDLDKFEEYTYLYHELSKEDEQKRQSLKAEIEKQLEARAMRLSLLAELMNTNVDDLAEVCKNLKQKLEKIQEWVDGGSGRVHLNYLSELKQILDEGKE